MGGLIGGEARKLAALDARGGSACDAQLSDAVAFSMAVLETNASMGRIVAAPTAGSAGVIPGVLLALQRSHGLSDDDLVRGLAAAAAVGYLVTRNATVSGAEGGCQAEVGSAAGMAAAAVVELLGGSAEQCLDAAGNALMSLMGLVCDPVAGLVEVPCQKRNAAGAAVALASAQIALAGQKRVGLNGRIFYIHKLRSMYMDAEERKKELMAKNEMNGLMFKMQDDPRITKVGKFIRKTSIDELPQFFDVLCGNMSLVGTRPPTVDEYSQYDSHHKRRLSMKPGITGLWQVSGRSDIQDFEEVVKLDVAYIDHWSLALDMRILFKTVGVVLRRTGAE